MKALSLSCFLGVVLLAGCGESNPTAADPMRRDAGGTNAAADYFQAAAQAQRNAAKTVDLAGINKAIETFYVQEGRFPKSLEELTEVGMLKKLPTAPAGWKFNYDTNSGILTVEKDKGKDLEPAEEP